MGKNIILLSDGTGNSAGKLTKTNVWRLYQAVDLATQPGQSEQLTYYDDGVGTASFKPLAILGGAFGYGLKRNVLDLYTFLCRHYQSGDGGQDKPDNIYGFGFSRGAFTIRVLVGLIVSQGLVRVKNESPRQVKTESEFRHLAAQAFRAYRAEKYPGSFLTRIFRRLRDAWLWGWYKLTGKKIYKKARDSREAIPIKFLGLWDTVAAYGLPFDELTQAWDFVFPLSFPNCNLSPQVVRACHALALDDERHSFHPELWNEATEKDIEGNDSGRITQVWFAGMHSNVGGGYPDDGMAHVPLKWIMDEAEKAGLRFKKIERDILTGASDVSGTMHDSRRGLGGAYRYLPRKLEALTCSEDDKAPILITTPKIHESVFKRIKTGIDGYAPIGLPGNYEICREDGQVEPLNAPPLADFLESPKQAENRAKRQETVWNLVWLKRLVYFITVFTALLLVVFPIIPWRTPYEEAFQFLTTIIGLPQAFLPDFLGKWFEAYKGRPFLFTIIVLVLSFWIILGSSLKSKIIDKMRGIFNDRSEAEFTFASGIFSLRKNAAGFANITKRIITPLLVSIILLWLIFALVARGIFTIQDSFGAFAPSTSTPELLDKPVEKTFYNNSLCWASGVKVEAGKRYRLSLVINGEGQKKWEDDTIPASINGFEKAMLAWGIPLRRHLTEPWFKPIARVGCQGADDYPLNPVDKPADNTLVAEITPRQDGELFLFVNDAVFPFVQGSKYFYLNNHGEAKVIIEPCPPAPCPPNSTNQAVAANGEPHN